MRIYKNAIMASERIRKIKKSIHKKIWRKNQNGNNNSMSIISNTIVQSFDLSPIIVYMEWLPREIISSHE